MYKKKGFHGFMVKGFHGLHDLLSNLKNSVMHKNQSCKPFNHETLKP